MSALKHELNLLPKEPWEKGSLGQLFRWIVSVGRYVVVFTELVVIGAFLFRFGLDLQLANLRETIKEQQLVINSFNDLETNFRAAQTKLNTVKSVSSQPRVLETLNTLNKMTPADATYTSITINAESVALEGTVLSQSGLATLLYNSQELPQFSDVLLENVQSATDKSSAIEFRMILTFKTT
jgi:hypothetical protein